MRNETNKTKVVLYTRVSTDDQKDHGYSLQDQYAQLTKFAELKGFEIVKHYQDDYSAKNFGRPEFQNFLYALKSKELKIDLLLVTRTDRFSRNLEESMVMVKILSKLGVKVYSLQDQEICFNDPKTYVQTVLQSTIAEYFNLQLSENTIRGMRQATKEGRWVWKVPLGYKRNYQTKGIMIDPEIAPLLVEGFEMVAKGIYSTDEVRVFLNNKGLKCSKQNFLDRLRNPVYKGKLYLKKWKDEPATIIQGLHEPLITEELFDEVQFIINNRRKTHSTQIKKNENLPMRGYLLCSCCGSNLTGSGSRSRNGMLHFYYHCQKKCKVRFRADVANVEFEKFLLTFKIDSVVLKLYLEILQEVFSQDDQQSKQKIKNLEIQLSKVEGRIASIEDKYADNQIPQEEYLSIKKRYEGDANKLIGELSTLMRDKSSFSKYFQYGISFLLNMPKYYREANLEVKQKIIGSIFPEKLIFENNQYRTSKVNELLCLLTNNINGFVNGKKKKAIISDGLSALAPSPGLEPGTP